MLLATTELLGTSGVVAKKIQVKFYVEGVINGRAVDVFEAQGLTLSEGMSRLLELLVDAPDELRPLLLRQAPGDAGRALAEFVLSGRAQRAGPVAFGKEVAPVTPLSARGGSADLPRSKPPTGAPAVGRPAGRRGRSK